MDSLERRGSRGRGVLCGDGLAERWYIRKNGGSDSPQLYIYRYIYAMGIFPIPVLFPLSGQSRVLSGSGVVLGCGGCRRNAAPPLLFVGFSPSCAC